MIFNLIDYLLGILKMIINKIFYFNKLHLPVIGKYSCTVQLRIFNQGSMIAGKKLLMRSGVKIRVNGNGKIIIGNRVGFNNDCMLNCMNKIKIGDNVIFGQGVKIYDHDHNYHIEGIIRDNGYITKNINIKDNVWIGSNCVILKGTNIGENTVIGANTVIYGDIPANSVVYGDRNLIIKKGGYK